MEAKSRNPASPHEGHRKRLLDRITSGNGDVSEADALEALLTFAVPRKDTRQAALELLARHGNIRAAIDAGMDKLQGITNYTQGIPKLFAAFKAVRTLYDLSPVRNREVIADNDVMYAVARTHLANQTVEEVWAAMLDTGLRLICWKRMARGGIKAAHIDIPEVLRECIVQRADGLILIHNHPGGNPAPSPQDMALTKNIIEAAKAVNVKVYDHLVITQDKYYAIIESKMI